MSLPCVLKYMTCVIEQLRFLALPLTVKGGSADAGC